MNGQHHADKQPDLRVTIDPEPSEEEFIAITQALQVMFDRDRNETASTGLAMSNWTRVARRESLRLSEWPPQRKSWESGSRK